VSVLVTGGAGFIGSHIVDVLVARGDDVVVLDDLSGGSRDNLPAQVPILQIDIADPACVSMIAEARPRTVIHAAAQVSVGHSMADPARDREVNVVGTAHLLDGAKRCGCQRAIFISTGGAIYGETSGASETAIPHPKSYYSAHKYLAERYFELSGVSYGIARLANVYGPRQRSDLEGGVVSIFSERLRAGEPIVIQGTGQQYRDFVYVTDVVSAVLAMLDSRLEGTWNVATGTATTVLELLDALQARIAPPTEICHEASRPGDLFASVLLNGQIRQDLGWQPRFDLAAGLDDMLR